MARTNPYYSAKAYNAIAQLLCKQKRHVEAAPPGARRFGAETMRLAIAADFVQMFKQDNPRFDADLFLTACEPRLDKKP